MDTFYMSQMVVRPTRNDSFIEDFFAGIHSSGEHLGDLGYSAAQDEFLNTFGDLNGVYLWMRDEGIWVYVRVIKPHNTNFAGPKSLQTEKYVECFLGLKKDFPLPILVVGKKAREELSRIERIARDFNLGIRNA